MENRDEQLWKIAKKRAKFKKHLTTYLVMNAFFWALWFFTQGRHMEDGEFGLPWPVWPGLGWGIGLAFQYFDAYQDDRETDTMKEFQKLKDREGKN